MTLDTLRPVLFSLPITHQAVFAALICERMLPSIVLFDAARKQQLQGGRVHQMPVQHFPRFAGTAKYNLWNRAWKPLIDTFGFRWIRSRWKNYEIGELSIKN